VGSSAGPFLILAFELEISGTFKYLGLELSLETSTLMKEILFHGHQN
jgi:hypothetical protein